METVENDEKGMGSRFVWVCEVTQWLCCRRFFAIHVDKAMATWLYGSLFTTPTKKAKPIFSSHYAVSSIHPGMSDAKPISSTNGSAKARPAASATRKEQEAGREIQSLGTKKADPVANSPGSGNKPPGSTATGPTTAPAPRPRRRRPPPWTYIPPDREEYRALGWGPAISANISKDYRLAVRWRFSVAMARAKGLEDPVRKEKTGNKASSGKGSGGGKEATKTKSPAEKT